MSFNIADCRQKDGDHVPCSLLYEDLEQFTDYVEDNLFPDLHLDEIIAAVTVNLAVYGLGAIYRQKPVRVQDVLFRQAIVRDLYNRQLTDILDLFVQELNLAKRHLKYRDQSVGIQPAAKWHLDSARIYCDAVEHLAGSLASFGNNCACSAGIRRFAAWLSEYVGCPDFSNFHKQVDTLAESVSQYRFIMRLDISSQIITIEQDTEERNYLDDLTADFAQYDLRELRRETVAFADSQINALESRILALIGQENPSLFTQMEQFRQEYPSIIDPQLLAFEREYLFFSSFLMFARHLESRGLPFSLPVLRAEQAICIHDGFDIALALTIKTNDLVLNDLVISPDEQPILLTGPNQGGKTTFSRMLGQTFFLASLGLPVPCRDAALFAVNGIQTHFVQQEIPGSLSGRLQEELQRLRGILMTIHDGCLVILNELFSSATTDDACEMAMRVMKLLRGKHCLCLYVTHVHELAECDLETVTLAAGISDNDSSRCTFRILRKSVKDTTSAQRLLHKYHLTGYEIEARKNAAITAVH